MIPWYRRRQFWAEVRFFLRNHFTMRHVTHRPGPGWKYSWHWRGGWTWRYRGPHR